MLEQDAHKDGLFDEGVRCALILIKINDAFEWKEGKVETNLSIAINCAPIRAWSIEAVH